jgi:hypothetical protein
MDIADKQIIEEVRHFGESIMQSQGFLQENLAANRTELQEKALLHCLGRSLDLAKGAVSTAIACVPVSLAVISRTMLEELITARWLCLDRNNAIKFQENSHASIVKLLRENMKGGYGKIVHKVTGEDCSQAVLDRLSSKSNMPKIEQKAKECKLHRLYSILYRSLSPLVHGSDFQRSFLPAQVQDAVKNLLSAAIVLHKVTYDIATTFLIERKITTTADIEKKLNVHY